MISVILTTAFASRIAIVEPLLWDTSSYSMGMSCVAAEYGRLQLTHYLPMQED